MGKKGKSKPVDLASAPASKPAALGKATERAKSDTKDTEAQAHPPALPPPPQKRGFARVMPEAGLFPWWAVLILSLYALLKMGMTLEHPCGILGTWSPITRAKVSKSYRSVSICTHPDKLVGRSASDIERGGMLFARASEARDQLQGTMKHAASLNMPEVGCSTQVDEAIVTGVMLVVQVNR